MATLFIDQTSIELRADNSALKLYQNGVYLRSLPLRLMERVVIQGNARLDANALMALTDAGASILFLSKRRSRRVAMVLGGAHGDARLRLAQFSLAGDRDYALAYAARLVQVKIRGQLNFLEASRVAQPRLRKPLTDAIAVARKSLAALRCPGDLAGVLGAEGAASAACFKAYTRVFPESLGFSGRNRRPPRDPVNALLSLAYTLVHHEAVAICHLVGLDPYVGFLHAPAHGRESRACDLMEPLRPRVDAWVLDLFRERVIRKDHFRLDKGACLLDKAGRERFYPAYEKFACAQRRRLRRHARLLARAIRTRKPWSEQDEGFEDLVS